MTELTALPKGITDQIRYILEGVKSGRLEHNQSSYHCGTAHCIAGWHTILNAEKWGLVYDLDNSEFEGDEDFDEWEEAKKDWELTSSEADILFGWNADLETQFVLLEFLESGKRVGNETESEDGCTLVYHYATDGLALVDYSEKVVDADSEFLRFSRERQKVLVEV